MKIYEINQGILDLIDENGEITDIEAFEALQMAKKEKLENIACYIKDLRADVEAFKKEEAFLAERRKQRENKADQLARYLERELNGESLETTRVKVSYRKTSAVEVQDDATFITWATIAAPSLLTVKYSPNKTAIKAYITGGQECPCAEIKERRAMQVK